MLPVPEANAVVVRPAAEVEDYTEDEETDDGDHLDGGEDELGLAINPFEESANGLSYFEKTGTHRPRRGLSLRRPRDT